MSEKDIEHSITNDTHTRRQKYHESDAGDGSRAIDQHLTGTKLYLTLFSTVLSLFVSALDQTIISTLLTEIGEEFGSFDKVGWLASAYMLPMATLAPSYGKISIAFGRKYTMLAGLAFFMVGSLICALSNSMDLLIGGRVIQGLGAGAVQAMVMVILTEVVPISKRSLSMSLIGITFSVASAAGPFVGGSFASHVTWRWCFYINLPIAGVAALVMFIVFDPPKPEGDIRAKLAKIDYLGTFLLSSGVVLVLLALTFGGNEFPWRSVAVILCFVLGGLMLILFTVYNFKYSKNPIIIKEAVTTPQVVIACGCGFFSFIQFMQNAIYLPLYFQVVKNASPFQSGVDVLPFIISVSISSTLNGVFLRAIRIVKIPLILCAVCSLLGSGLLLLLNVDSSFGTQFGVSVVNGIGAGISFQATLLSAQLNAPNTVEGSLIVITVFNNFIKALGGVIGVVLGQLILQTTAKSEITSVLTTLTPGSQEYQILSSTPVESITSSPQIIYEFPRSLRRPLLEAYVKAFHTVYYFMIAVSAALMILSVFSTNKILPKDKDVETKEKKEKEKKEKQKQHKHDELVSTTNDEN